MKKIVLILIFLIFISETSSEPLCKVSYFYGDVTKKLPPKDWDKVFLDEGVVEGEWFKTGFDSKAELSLIDGSILRIAENSYLEIEGLEGSGNPYIRFRATLKNGRVWAKLKKLTKKSVFSIKNPIVVAGARGTEFRIDMLPDTSTRIRVYTGEISVKNEPLIQRQKQEQGKLEKPHQVPGPHRVEGPKEVTMEEWFVIVKAQQELWISKTGKYNVKDFSLAEDTLDEWVKWNRERDKKMGE
uniref:FecR protein domain-containing protein n=1 Tax=candidate division WOR-3 bacterium TaxID=2052148 RepID=A0A7C4UD26_UNCW3